MGFYDQSCPGDYTSFSCLEESKKGLVAEVVANQLLTELNRNVSVIFLKEIFEHFDVDVQISEEGSFNILKNQKLEVAVKRISAKF